jgi:hypothetical protein
MFPHEFFQSECKSASRTIIFCLDPNRAEDQWAEYRNGDQGFEHHVAPYLLVNTPTNPQCSLQRPTQQRGANQFC